MSPTYSRNQLAISLLTGVKDAKLDSPDEISGHWRDELGWTRSKSPSKTIVEQFLNWADDPGSILRFVLRYGPLSKPQPGELSFHQSIQEWRKRQTELRAAWRSGQAAGFKIGMRVGEMLVVRPAELELAAEDLSRFLELEIYTHPATRRRVCERPDCPNPYFIATHKKTTLCSDVCKAWKQRQHQLKWWADHGDQWREDRRKRLRDRRKNKFRPNRAGKGASHET